MAWHGMAWNRSCNLSLHVCSCWRDTHP
jgi:hypothetical protein